MTAADCKALQILKVKTPNTGSIEAQINQKRLIRSIMEVEKRRGKRQKEAQEQGTDPKSKQSEES
ncbi:5136_t:CDS:2 [Funneliformis mosseae]|uniref:5136_t:CDS:1 n=1 Tax=Funneliformis mosseae TaxID=27381 RepID=A0A9N9ET61_FUNMO|nr:5136_t:CDS:2 [Funneliformis mosseae]